MSTPDGQRERRFASVYESVYPDLLQFVQRRAHPDHAEDVVAETFLVLWRRWEERPRREEDVRAWLFGTARHLLLNAWRGENRRQALAVRIADQENHHAGDRDAEHAVLRADLTRAWAMLSATHQEALALAVLDDLPSAQAAAVLGISPVAFRLRLSRARRALRMLLDHQPRPTGAHTHQHRRATTP